VKRAQQPRVLRGGRAGRQVAHSIHLPRLLRGSGERPGEDTDGRA
jgi:hypothetical protein